MLETESLNTVEWWVDASFSLHPSMCSYTGCLLLLGGGGVYASSTKQKLNIYSSTEAELVILYEAKLLAKQGLIVFPSYIKTIRVLCF